ncbi:DUF4254 domain-containing protein [Nocardia sp. NPDC051570]|uniref:DUF4254 domain-containing protein n=1 Tax=Nocardia sp. NPDC051570 TaxID=3364324 RepID=UPI00379A499E
MGVSLPSRDLILEACAGRVHLPHPVLRAAGELADLHRARLAVAAPMRSEIDCCRVALVHEVDRWVASVMPVPHGAAWMHTETVGTVVDRLAEFSVNAYVALEQSTSQWELHLAWQRLAELSLGYSDMAFGIAAGTLRVPDFGAPRVNAAES